MLQITSVKVGYYNVETSSAVAINDNGKGGDLFEITLDFFAGSIHPGYFFGLGYDRILKNYDLCRVQLAYNTGSSQMMKGNYKFYNNNLVAGEGSLSSNGAYVSLGVSYIFSRVKGLRRYVP